VIIGRARADLRAGIIGAGLMGRWHAQAVRDAGHRVVAVHDPDDARAGSLAGTHGATACESADGVVDAADVVHVCSPLVTHVEMSSRALRAGRTVVCEKPLAGSAEEVRALYALAQAHRALLVPTHQFLFQRGVRAALRVLPTMGTLLHLDVTACTAGASGRDADGAEAVALDVLPHPMSLVERAVPGALARIRWQVAATPPGELRITGHCEQVSVGVLVSCAGRPPVNVLRFVTTGGTVTVDLFHGFHVVDRGAASRAGKLLRPFLASARTIGAASTNLVGRAARRESAYPGLRALIGATYAAAQGLGACPIEPAEAIEVARACEAIAAARARLQA